MATEISGRNYELTPKIRKMIETKLSRVEARLFDDVIDVRCVLQVEKYRNICEILIVGKEQDVKAVQESDESMEEAVNAAIDHVKRQAQKNGACAHGKQSAKAAHQRRQGQQRSQNPAIGQGRLMRLVVKHFSQN